MQGRVTSPPGIDLSALARGSFRGFFVLITGTLLFPVVAREIPAIATVWLSLVSIGGFACAACHQGIARRSASQGAIAAIGALGLILPLLLLGPAVDDPVPLLLTAVTAPVTGVVVGGVVIAARHANSRVLCARGDGSWRSQ